jgi:prophage antirepressor-like protein
MALPLSVGASAQITPFLFETHTVRVVMRDGEPWFVASDVCDALGYALVPHAMRMLDDDEKGIHILDTLGGQQKASVISESGLFTLVLRSRKPEARKFFKWVTGKVLPSIRKTGSYGPAHSAALADESLPAIDPAALLLSGQSDPTTALPPELQQAIDLRAWTLAHEAYGLAREHLARRVAFQAVAGTPRRVDMARAQQVISEGTLATALTRTWHNEMRTIVRTAEMTLSASLNALESIRAAAKGGAA